MYRWLGAATLVIGLVVTPSLSEARPGPDRIRRLQVAISEVLEREQVPGAGIALVDRRGVFWTGGVGLADLDTQRPVTSTTLFRVGSITKSFVALAAARLHEQGVLDLDQPLADIIPDVAATNPWANDVPITLAHVLEHTAGFDDMRFNELGGDGAESTPLLDVLARNPRSRVARWRPGTRFSYSNPGYTVAAAAIERMTGTDYRDVIRRQVLQPLGIRDAHFALDDTVAARLARGYERPGVATPYVGIYHHPAGTLMTTPAELGVFVHRWLTRSTAVVSPAMLARIERAETLPYPATDVAYGLGNYGDARFGALCRGHDGGLPGFVSTYSYCPDLGVGYVVLTNATFSPRAHAAISRLVFRALTEGTTLPAPPEAPPSAEERRRVAGYYGFASPRHELFGFIDRLVLGIEFVDTDGALVARPLLGGEHRLVRTGANRYRLEHEATTTIRFARDRRGNDILVLGPGVYFERGHARPAKVRLRLIGTALRVMLGSLAAFAALFAMWLVTGFRPANVGLLACPALSSACLFAAASLPAMEPFGALGTPSPAALLLCALTVLHAVLAAAGVAVSLRALARDRFSPGLFMRLSATGASLACAGVAAWLGAHGIIGLRTWAW